MYTISECATRTGITPRALRFYEEKQLVTPERDAENNYRLYTEKNLQELLYIRHLRDLGLSVDQIKNLIPSEPSECFALKDRLCQLLKVRLHDLEANLIAQKQQVQQIKELLQKVQTTNFHSKISVETVFSQSERKVMMKTLTQAHSFSHPVQRQSNEDSQCIDKQKEREIYVVADGIKSSESANTKKTQASQWAIKKFCASQHLATLSPQNYESILKNVLNSISAEIYKASNKQETTLSALILKGKNGYIAHVGDSRVYRFAQGQLTCLTEDHSTIQKLLTQEKILEKDVSHHPKRDELYSILGYYQKPAAVQVEHLAVQADSTYLLCTDGITKTLSDTEISEVLSRYDLKNQLNMALEQLKTLAVKHGEDNATAIGVYVKNRHNTKI